MSYASNFMSLLSQAERYLRENKERFTPEEKEKFRRDLGEYFLKEHNYITDEVYDFFTTFDTSRRPREEVYLSYLNNKYSYLRFSKICDVGAGRLCKLSSALARLGSEMYAIDPNIRISQKEASLLGIKSISKNRFVCDKFSSNGKGTDISKYDLILGLAPCGATEHIIHQSLKYDKPFNVLLCYEAHNAITGKTFRTPEEWFEYLASISSEVKIEREKNNFFATNSSTLEKVGYLSLHEKYKIDNNSQQGLQI